MVKTRAQAAELPSEAEDQERGAEGAAVAVAPGITPRTTDSASTHTWDTSVSAFTSGEHPTTSGNESSSAESAGLRRSSTSRPALLAASIAQPPAPLPLDPAVRGGGPRSATAAGSPLPLDPVVRGEGPRSAPHLPPPFVPEDRGAPRVERHRDADAASSRSRGTRHQRAAKARLLELERELLRKDIELQRLRIEEGSDEDDDGRSQCSVSTERRVSSWVQESRAGERQLLALEETPQHVSPSAYYSSACDHSVPNPPPAQTGARTSHLTYAASGNAACPGPSPGIVDAEQGHSVIEPSVYPGEPGTKQPAGIGSAPLRQARQTTPPTIDAPIPSTTRGYDDYGTLERSTVQTNNLLNMFERQQQLFLQGLTELSHSVSSPTARSAAKSLVELQPYSGAYDEWYAWRDTFECTARHFSDAENKARLRRSLRGPARELVDGLLKTTATAAEIVSALEDVYGRPDCIVYTELEKLKTLPRLTDSGKELPTFACKVDSVISTIVALKKEAYLVSPQTLHAIEEKMSALYRTRWFDYEARDPADEPSLLKLRRFLKCEMKLQVRHIRPEATAPPRPAEPPRRAQRVHAASSPERPREKKEDKRCGFCTRSGHATGECRSFKSLTLDKRWEACRQKKLCFRCLNHRGFRHRCGGKKCELDDCPHFHHELLHRPPSEAACATDEKAMRAVSSAVGTPTLLNIVPVIVTGPTGTAEVYALLDSGSTITLIKEDTARSIGAEGPSHTLSIEGIAGSKFKNASQLVTFAIRGKHHTEEYFIDARTIPDLGISGQSVARTAIQRHAHLRDLADQLPYEYAVPSILIGQDNWELMISNACRTGRHEEPVATLTGLGWVVHGPYVSGERTTATSEELVEVHRVMRLRPVDDDNLDQLLKEHFALESLGVEPRRPRSDPELRAMNILEATTRRKEDGSFEVGLLWKNEAAVIPDNYDATLRRLEGVERKLDKNPSLKARYTEQMNRMVEDGYAEIATTKPTPGRTWYLPHFAVTNPAKPGKTRIVHDAAATTKGVSLNSLLLTGPDLLQSLPGVLMRFRQRGVAVTADIKDMFLRVGIREEDRDALRFLWRGEERQQKPREYRMKAVIFGATSSPATAIYIKNKNADDFRHDYPEAADAIIRNHYMDDYLQSFSSVEEAQRITSEVDFVHRKGHFVLSKWTSNEPAAIGKFAPTPNEASKDLDTGGSEKILGLVWRSRADTLGFNLNMARVPTDVINGDKVPTKRETLRTAMSLFDPLGLATPITIQAKHVLQDTWRLGVGWDDQLPTELADRWRHWLQDLRGLADIALPRCYPGYDKAEERELHTFTDASETTYAAAVYWRVKCPGGDVRVSLAAAKARVTPLKTISIPRLELQAAVLGTRLATTVQEEHDEKPTRRVFWTDSKTVLAWLRAGPRVFKPFVAHRVAEIEEASRVSEWRWVPTKENVADDATREAPLSFDNTHRWFHGPAFLYQSDESWPEEPALPSVTTGEEKVNITRNNELLSESLPDPTRFSSWLRLIRATGRVIQFLRSVRRHSGTTTAHARTRRNPEADPAWAQYPRAAQPLPSPKQKPAAAPDRYVPLDANDLRDAERLWLRAMQQQAFPDDLACTRKNAALPPDSRIRNLAVFIDDDDIMRVKSRIDAAEGATAAQRTPPIADGSHPYTRLYIDWIHRELHHGGTETVANELKQRLWVLRLRPTVKGVLRNCQPCRLRRAKPPSPPTGNLPPCRLAHHQRPFTYTGLDFFGPLSVTVGRQHQKRYVALFTCLTTRAVHLELTAHMTTDSCIMALRRMMARRGRPTEIWSDNGTNLRGSDAELRRALDEQQLTTAATNLFIKWRFIVPGAPFWGGAWERLVRSVKTALRVVLHEQHPHEETLVTLLAEVEDTVNSRPLTYLPTDEHHEALTPNHFLLGGPSRVQLPGTFNDSDLRTKKAWRASQRLADLFWARWLREYLPTLQHRREPHGKGEEVRVGDLVLIVDATQPRNTWLRGLIVAVFPGADGITRAADVKTSKGVLRRPVKKLVVLPIHN